MRALSRKLILNLSVVGAVLFGSGLFEFELAAQFKDDSGLLDPNLGKDALIYAPGGLPFEQSKLGDDHPDPSAGEKVQNEMLLDSLLTTRAEGCSTNLTEEDLLRQAEAAIDRIYNLNNAQGDDGQVVALQREQTLNAVRRQISNQNCNQLRTK